MDATAAISPLAILVVDDQQPMRKTIVFILRQLGYRNVTCAEDGDIAWNHINNRPVDLVLLDWNMPRMSGLSLLNRIRASEDYRKLPVVMITAEANEDHVVTAVQAGVTNYIVKPFSPRVLDKKIHEALAAHGLR
ncbi:response regulator [Solidesulfovibrio sp.]|jgi:two-component system chemotaxis response regulator CheY|uniref:response regulator n=1 Tax=Solidesulfovibrio sp. TaxID=2910990 RepID=UPI000EEBE0C2|nr:response regulator [Solidesulfovibrio sp.]MEA5090078.1 response regulator [Solidesulfovibrio sp.]HCR14365.1 response regulator [Desulfovibrio sp.]HML59784.1 response regulator [Solidesulfovibrio sp.]